MKSRNLLPLMLMAASIVLLLVLQGFWLLNSYEKAYMDLRKDVNDVFRTTVFALRDSLLVRNIERVSLRTDTTSAAKPEYLAGFSDSLDKPGGTDSRRLRKSKSQMQIIISSGVRSSDSLKSLLRPVASQLIDAHGTSGHFMVRLSNDALSLDTLRFAFREAVDRAGIPGTFEVTQTSFDPEGEGLAALHHRLLNAENERTDLEPKSLFSDSLQLEWVRFDPMNRYAATMFEFKAALYKEITPQILFSVFLTLITAAAFIIMYRSIRSQQRLMELKNDFISNITHELKTPVTTVSVALEALRDFNGLGNPTTTKEYLDIAQSELTRLTLLTDKILKTAIFEAQGTKFDMESVDLHDAVEQVLHSMKLVFEKQKAEVRFDRAGDSFVIQGGTVHLTNVIYNLLDNALKYSAGEPKISISLEEEPGRVRLTVADKGIGIPAEYRSKIFEKFFRVPAGDVHNTKGYGLGLSYVDKVIRGHQGSIEVDSKAGEGSIFRISLPKLVKGQAT